MERGRLRPRDYLISKQTPEVWVITAPPGSAVFEVSNGAVGIFCVRNENALEVNSVVEHSREVR
jgi:hypothetical protein